MRGFFALCIGGLLGCQGVNATLSPARLVDATDASLDELRRVLTRATGTENPRIGDTAFRDTHILVLQPDAGASPQARAATGRMTGTPRRFHLLSDGQRCVLEDVNSGERYELADASCEVLAPR